MRREIHLSASKRTAMCTPALISPVDQKPETYAVKAQLDIGDPQRFPNVEMIPRADILNMAQEFCADVRQVVYLAVVRRN